MMDANHRPKPQPRIRHGRRSKEHGSTTYSSSDEDFHSDDNLRPYEEVKIAHHDKKLAGLGLAPEKLNVTPIERGEAPPQRLYSYMSGSDGDIEVDNALSNNRAPQNWKHGSQSSVSSEEYDNGTRDNRVSQLTFSDSETENIPQQSYSRAGTLPLPPPMLPPPPPPPPIEDIPQRSPPIGQIRRKSFGPSTRGNYAELDGIAVRHTNYSEGEGSDFEPHYLVQTSSGNVFVPPNGPRYPRSMIRAGSMPAGRTTGDVACIHNRPGVFTSYPQQHGCTEQNNITQNNGDSRHAFTFPQFGAPPTVPMGAFPPGQDYNYYSKFSSASHRMKKHLKQRCSWKCTALILLIVCVGLLACVAYFAAMLMFEEEEVARDASHRCLGGAVNASRAGQPTRKYGGYSSSLPPHTTPATDLFHIGEIRRQNIPPKSFWNTQFIQDEAKFIKFNFSLPNRAVLAVYGRKNILPTHARYDFFEIFDGRTISNRKRRATSQDTENNRITDTALIQYLGQGMWFLSLYNDNDHPQKITFSTDYSVSLDSGCPGDCHGHGDCRKGQCKCFPGYTSWDCSQSSCPILCNENGLYDRGQCHCHPGWKGQECELLDSECEVPNCNGNGLCVGGQCVCRPGYRGLDCGIVDCLLPNCSGNGACIRDQCHCFKGFSGWNCSQHDIINISYVCNQNCSGHGTFDIDQGKCRCARHFTGRDCETENCRLDCYHGVCQNQRCVCHRGWTGALCDQVSCDKRCDAHGFCDNGTCDCKKGWNGKHCTLDGCPHDCYNNGNCMRFQEGWKCNCRDGWKGPSCNVAMESQCQDMKDNDKDGLRDCMDPDCCMSMACRNSLHCRTAPDPLEILLRRQPPSMTASFYEKMRFLIADNSVQTHVSTNAFNESQVSVIRGQVVSKDGSPLIGATINILRQPLYGSTLTREQGLFDILVNGGGSVTLNIVRQPFRAKSASVLVPWNQIITMDTVVMTLHGEEEDVPEASDCSIQHEHYLLRPVVLSTWQHTQLGACPEKSTIIPESQVLQESIAIPASDVYLVYHSSETQGYKSVILIQMTPSSIPAKLALVHLRVSVEGIIMRKVFEADPGLKYTFSWDRRNSYRQKVYGIVTARVSVGYQYQNCKYIFWDTRSTTMSGYDLTSSEIGGWNLDFHHTYNFQEGILHKGDGTNIYIKEKPRKLVKILGSGHRRKLDCDGCNGKTLNNRLLAPVALASGLDGSLYVGDYNFIRKLSPNREEVASILEISTSSVPYKYYMTVNTVDGMLYISDFMSHQIIRVKTMGPVRDLKHNYEVVAGNGEECTPGELDLCGDNGLAIDARLRHPKGIAINKDGVIYIADGANIRIITTNGVIKTLIGSQEQLRKWTPMPCDDIMSVEKVHLRWPTSLAIDPLDDTLHILDHNIVLKMTKDNKLVTVAGRPVYCSPKHSSFLPVGVLTDDEQASNIADHVSLVSPESLTFGPHGDLFIVESDTHHINRIRLVTTDGRIHHFAGAKSKCDCQKKECKCYDSKEILAAQALFNTPTSITVTPDGVMHIADMGNLRIYSVFSELPQPNNYRQYEVLSPETQELYIFNRYGQHQHTINVMTNQYMYNFTYNVNSFYGKLTIITDSGGDNVRIVRDSYTQAKEIISPSGAKCHLVMDNMRRLHKFTSPNNVSTTFTYLPSTGLLVTKHISDGKIYYYEYDDTGRLSRIKQPTGEITSLSTDVNATTGSIVHVTTGSSDAVAMATYGSVQSVLHGSAETKVTYLPDGAVVVVFPNNLTVAMETGVHPILEAEHRMHFKRKVVMPNLLGHRLEWRFYVRRKGRTKQNRQIEKVGQKLRVMPHFSRHANMHESHEDGYKGKALMINGINLLTVEYDRDLHAETISDKLLNEIVTFMYNANGLPTSILPAVNHHSLNITYNDYGDLLEWRYGELVERRTYNVQRLLTEKVASNHAKYRYIYRYGMMPTDVILPSGRQYLFQYDNRGDLKEVTTPTLGKHKFYTIISIGLQRFFYHPPGLSKPFIQEYDGNGKLLQTQYPSGYRRVLHLYNDHRQLVKLLFDESEARFEYDERIGKLSQAQVLHNMYGCRHIISYQGAMISNYEVKFLQDRQLLGAKFSYVYDNNFRLSYIQSVFSNNVSSHTNFTYSKETGKLVHIKFFQVHRPLQDRDMLNDRHLTILREYDRYSRIQDVQYKFDDKVRFMLQINYDDSNRVHQWRRRIGQTDSKALEYVYDIDSNIINVLHEGKSAWHYEYDANGNIGKITQHGKTIDVVFDVGDRVKLAGEKQFLFDQDGFMIQRGNMHLRYNSLGQLVKIMKPAGYTIHYYYDVEGRLIAHKDSVGNVMQYFYADVTHPHFVTHTYNHSTSDLSQYHYDMDGMLLAMERNRGRYYIANDPMGTPLVVFDTRGFVVKQMNFDPLGVLESDSNPNFEFTFGFQGNIYQHEIRLMFIKSRPYDPELGRWMSPDYPGVFHALKTLTTKPSQLNLFQYQEFASLRQQDKAFPRTDIPSWLSLLGYDIYSMAPDVSYTGQVHPTDRIKGHELLPTSSAFECTFRRDMDSLLTISTVPRSKISPSNKMPELTAASMLTLFGDGVMISNVNGRARVNLIGSASSMSSKLAMMLLNNSDILNLHFIINKKDVHYFVKPESSAADDLKALNIKSDVTLLSNGINLSVHRSEHANNFHDTAHEEVDIRIHGNHSIINVRYGTTVQHERQRVLRHAKERAVKHAWEREKYFLLNNIPSDYRWTEREKKDITTAGYADSYIGEFIKNPEDYPELCDDSNNIQLVKRAR